MGYQDRDYFRDGSSPYLELIRSTRVCWGIVLTLGLVYLLVVFTSDFAHPWQDYLRLAPAAMIHNWQWYRLLTATLITENPWHLAFALFVIWIVGHELEQIFGGKELLAFFVVASILSNLAQTLIYYYLSPENLLLRWPVTSFGPAGAAVAMVAWAAALWPQRVVTYLLVPMPLWVVAGLALVFDLFFFMQFQPLAVKLGVHVLSLAFAISYALLNWRLTNWPQWNLRRRSATVRRQLTPAMHVPTRRQLSSDLEGDPEEPVVIRHAVDEQLEAKLDAVLEKVSLSGMQSLTDDEKEVLKRASEVMKRKKS